MNIHSLSHKHTYTSIHIDARPLIYDFIYAWTCTNHTDIFFISRTNNQLRRIKMIPKLLLFCLSLQIKRMHLLATSKKPLLAPISPNNRTLWSSSILHSHVEIFRRHEAHCQTTPMQTSTHSCSNYKWQLSLKAKSFFLFSKENPHSILYSRNSENLGFSYELQCSSHKT